MAGPVDGGRVAPAADAEPHVVDAGDGDVEAVGVAVAQDEPGCALAGADVPAADVGLVAVGSGVGGPGDAEAAGDDVFAACAEDVVVG